MWTKFMDMRSGGGRKEPYKNIYIEASEEDANIIFYNRFGHSPQRVSCTCCGEDYSVTSASTFAEVSAFARGCAWDNVNKTWLDEPEDSSWNTYSTVDNYLKRDDILVISSDMIREEERVGSIPTQGYVWVD